VLRLVLQPVINHVDSAGGAMSERFPDMAKRAFSFLEGAGFRLKQSDAGQLRYESAQSVVDIVWDARSGELEAFVGLYPQTGLPKDTYSLTDVCGMEAVPDRKMPPQVADENRLRPFVDQLAEDMRVHAQPALAGDRMFFRRLETYRHARAEAFGRSVKLQQVRSAVEDAWRKRDFKKVIGLYASVESDLTEAEKRKLEYAREHQAG
jgi:hypothetical protein